jgi:predicted  nucleic acid-binding Zn-ribbon protein
MTPFSIIPFPLWILSAALTIATLLIMFIFYAYWRHRQRAFLKDGGDVAQLAARKQQLEADINAIREWMKQQKAELERFKSERDDQERGRAELTDLERRCSEQENRNQNLRKEVGELENQKHLISQTLERLKEEVGTIEANRDEAEKLKHEIAEIKARLLVAQNTLAKVADSEIRLEALQREVDSMRAEKEMLGPTIEKARIETLAAKDELEDQQAEVSRLRSERAQLEILVASLRDKQHSLEADVERLNQKESGLEEKISALNQVVKEHAKNAKLAELDYSDKRQRLERIHERLDADKKTLSGLEAHKVSLEREIERLQGQMLGTGTEEIQKAYDDLLKRTAACLKKDEFAPTHSTDSEHLALQQFKNELRKSGIYFLSRVIDAFHTSLKCQSINPLTVLAGVSGTGKTMLPVKYAEYMGLHSLVIPVQPRWDSPQDLFGFYNYLEKGYKATELSRALVRMDPYNYDPKEYPGLDYDWPRERLLMVLLDEMNLARTEYYFSEFLSKLELRRLVENPAIPAHREKAEIELDTGPGSNRSFRIWVPENLLFVGTMNEDETTQTLSDKVLDRSNVLRFGKPDERHQHHDENRLERKARPFLTRDQWLQWCKKTDGNDVWQQKMGEWIRRLNNGLEKVGRPFGYRVQDAIALYLANYPDAGQDDRYRLAFADQVEQKIIPKLRGLDVAEPNTMGCLQEVASVIGSLGDGELSSTFASAIEESKNMGMFTWRGVTRSL